MCIISNLITGKLFSLKLHDVDISSSDVSVIIRSLNFSQLCKLKLEFCTIPNSDFCHLITAISSSSVKFFTSTSNYIQFDEAVCSALVRALTHSEILEEVDLSVPELSIEIARPLVEAMNNSNLKKLKLGRLMNEENVVGWSYPIDRVEILFCKVRELIIY